MCQWTRHTCSIKMQECEYCNNGKYTFSVMKNINPCKFDINNVGDWGKDMQMCYVNKMHIFQKGLWKSSLDYRAKETIVCILLTYFYSGFLTFLYIKFISFYVFHWKTVSFNSRAIGSLSYTAKAICDIWDKFSFHLRISVKGW